MSGPGLRSIHRGVGRPKVGTGGLVRARQCRFILAHPLTGTILAIDGLLWRPPPGLPMPAIARIAGVNDSIAISALSAPRKRRGKSKRFIEKHGDWNNGTTHTRRRR